MLFKNIAEALDETEATDKVSLTPSVIEKRYGYLNKLLFDGELPQDKITFRTVRSTRRLAHAIVRLVPDSGVRRQRGFIGRLSRYRDPEKRIESFEIGMATNYPMNQEQFDGLLAHEMVHIWCMANGYFSSGHDIIFKDKLSKVQAKATFKIPLAEDVGSLPKIAASAGKRVLAVVRQDNSGKYSGSIYASKLIPDTKEKADEIAERFGKRFYATKFVKLYDTTTSLFLQMTLHNSMKNLNLYRLEDDEVKTIIDNGKEIGDWSSAS